MTAPTQPRQLTAEQIAALIVLIDAQSRLRAQLSAAAVAAATAAFAAITNWWDGKQTTRAVTEALRVIQPHQRQAARITAAYLARAVRVMTGRDVRPAGAVDVTRLRREMPARLAEAIADGRLEPPYLLLGEHDPQNRRVNAAPTINEPLRLVIPDPHASAAQRLADVRAGIPAAEVVDPGQPYGRVADNYRMQVVAKDTPGERLRRYTLARVAALAHTDITLAIREQERASLIDMRDVTGWRRILRPELSESGPCGLCVVAADRVYSTQDLRPIHGRCVCTVLPIVGDMDPGLTLNGDDLDRIYAAAGSNKGRDLKKIRVALAEHGELGPVLVDADQHWRGPKQVAPLKAADPKKRLQAQLDGWEESYAKLIRRREAGQDVERQMDWHEARMDELRRELAGV